MTEPTAQTGEIKGRVISTSRDFPAGVPIVNAEVDLQDSNNTINKDVPPATTDLDGNYHLTGVPLNSQWRVKCIAFGAQAAQKDLTPTTQETLGVDLDLKLPYHIHLVHERGAPEPPIVQVGKPFMLSIGGWRSEGENPTSKWSVPPGFQLVLTETPDSILVTALKSGLMPVQVTLTDITPGTRSQTKAQMIYKINVPVAASAQFVSGQVDMRLQRTLANPTLDQALWVAIRARTHAIHFPHYQRFMNQIFAHRVLGDEKLPLRGER